MKRRILCLLVLLAVFSWSACFGATLAAASKTASPPTGAILIGNGYHGVMIPVNPDGTLGGIWCGSLKVNVGDVTEVVFSGEHAGKLEHSQARGQYNQFVPVTVIPNVANNDKGKYYVKTGFGKYFQLKEDTYSVTTWKPMYHKFAQESTEYGEQGKTKMELAMSSATTVDITIYFGSDLPIGVRGATSFAGISEIDFVSESGVSYGGSIQYDDNGNAFAKLANIQLARGNTGLSVKGKMFALGGGSPYQLEFNPAGDGAFFWAAPHVYYVFADDSIFINY